MFNLFPKKNSNMGECCLKFSWLWNLNKHLTNSFYDFQIIYTRIFVPDTHRRSVANIQRFFETSEISTIHTIKKNISFSSKKPSIQQISSLCDTTLPTVSNVTMMDWCFISCTGSKDARTGQESHFTIMFSRINLGLSGFSVSCNT